MQQSSGSFEFFDDYAQKAYSLQPGYYGEIRRLVNIEMNEFYLTHGSKPLVLDVGAAGLLPYDVELAESVTILDLFAKPGQMVLAENIKWIVGDILSPEIAKHLSIKYDLIILSSLLHHLCDQKNNARRNLNACIANCSSILHAQGKINIVESTCSKTLAKLQDILFPIYNLILLKLFNFTHVRMLSVEEIAEALRLNGLSMQFLPFKRPEYIAQMYWKVPARIYPLSISFVSASKDQL